MVIAIIGTLASITTFAFGKSRDKGNDARRKADLKAIQTAAVSYYQDHSQFPPDPAAYPGNVFSSDTGAGWLPGISSYINKLPKDPLQAGILHMLASVAGNSIHTSQKLLAGMFAKSSQTTKVTPQVAADTTVTLRPAGVGSSTQWTPIPSAPNYAKVNEAVADGATYVKSNTNGFLDLYKIDPNTISGTITGITVKVVTRGDSGQDPMSYIYIRTGGTNYASTGFQTGSTGSFSSSSASWTTNPKTGVAWTASDITALEIGILNSGGASTTEFRYLTQEYVEVTYTPTGTTVNINANTTDDTIRFYASGYYPPDPGGGCSIAPPAGSTYSLTGQYYTGGGYYKYRSYLAFDTSSVPAGSTINSVTLTQTVYLKNLGTNFNLLVLNYNWGPTVDCTRWGGSPPTAPQVGSLATTTLPAVGSTFTMTLANSVVNTGGTTYLMLISDRDMANTTPTGLEAFGSYSAESATPPQISINYSPPAMPTVTTHTATGVTSTQATLNGSATPFGAGTNGWFRYDTVNPGTCNDTFGTRAPLSGFNDLTLSASYSQTVGSLTPSRTYYFCALASNAGGTGYGSVLSFTTSASAPTGSISASPTTIPSGFSSSVTWGSTGATSCTVSPTGWTGTSNPGQSTGPLTSTTTYTLNCTGPGGSSTPVSVTVTVGGAATPTDIKANGLNGPITVSKDDSVGISWTSGNMTSCTVTGGPGGSGTSGAFSWIATTTTTFNLSCTGPAGGQTDSVTVNVGAAAACPNLKNVYCYIVNTDRSAFVIWAELDNTSDSQIWDQQNAICKRTPPSGTPYNYCVESSSL